MDLSTALKSVGVKNVARTQTIIYGAGAVIGGVIVILIVRKVFRSIKEKDAKTYTAREMDDEVQDLNVSSRNLTITDGDAVLIAQNLLAAMNRMGTDEQSIYQNLDSLQTRDDLLLVIQKFGIKPYSGTGLATGWLAVEAASMKNLNGWLRAELNKRETEKVREIYERLGVNF